MFSDAPHHKSVYSHYDELAETEKQSYQSEKTAVTTAQYMLEELKEMRQETASLAYLCQCITARTPRSLPLNATASSTTSKRRRESSSLTAPVDGPSSSGMLHIITNINFPLKELTKKRRKA
ncbi:hypothetical protein EDD18DRAFT_1105424 [Armillaria luteobubalina]|uniref:Uncharacterized protein n=1 Tax=Armillaria luteobubalina TaxID=153913 RepID=A0AA39UP04_9AGAR|nr:hypothetical protein EDD18DRAFT_1105424 [Armillaria luteobubalina]